VTKLKDKQTEHHRICFGDGVNFW